MASQKIVGQHYELLKAIGQGGMGDVFLGRDVRTGEQVAVKRLKHDIIELEPELLLRFEREGEALRRVNHPNIVKMLAAFSENDEHYLVMEYVTGGSLRDLLDEQPQLSVERTLEIALDLADALTRAHRLKIIHRDIKPPNVLLAEDGTPRLTDFGVARLDERTRMTETGSLIGTYAYLSPEMCNGESTDERTDIWSFGVMLYEMLAGRRPFDGPQPAAVILAIIDKPLPDLGAVRPDVPRVLINLINRMLEKDRDQRISNMRLIGAELDLMLRWSKRDAPGVAAAKVLPKEELQRSERFATPTPSEVVKAKEESLAAPKEPSQASFEAYLEALPSPLPEKGTPPTSPSIVPASQANAPRRNNLLLGALAVFALVAILSVFALYQSNNSGDDASSEMEETADNVADASLVPPVAPGEYMVLVAEIEPVGASERAVTRFILDDLRQRLENEVAFSPYRVRAYPEVITSAEEARAVAETVGANVVVWGFYDEAFVTLNIQTGVIENPENIPVSLETLRMSADVRVRLTNERVETIAQQVIVVNQVLATGRTDSLALSLNIGLLRNLETPNPEIIGNSTAARIHRYFLYYINDTEQAIEQIDAALQTDSGNPLLYMFRVAANQRLNQGDIAQRDLNTLERLTPGWPIIYFAKGNNYYFIQNNPDLAIEEYSAYLAASPDDWYILTVRGLLYYAMGDYTLAKADLDRAVALDSQVNWTYLVLTLLAWREGRITDARAYANTIIDEFPEPSFAEQFLEIYYTSELSVFFSNFISSGVNLILGRYDFAARDAATALQIDDTLSDLHLTHGLALCGLQEYEAAENAFTEAITRQPDNALYYVARASARLELGDLRGAIEDSDAARAVNPPDGIVRLIDEGLQSGLTCQNFFEYQP